NVTTAVTPVIPAKTTVASGAADIVTAEQPMSIAISVHSAKSSACDAKGTNPTSAKAQTSAQAATPRACRLYSARVTDGRLPTASARATSQAPISKSGALSANVLTVSSAASAWAMIRVSDT